jgi:NAD(P)-dependent dehydrogenase (short-subunit alcohol dehydrogenase family)
MGCLDGLVNTAGIIVSGNLAATTDEIWRHVVEANLQKVKGSAVVNLASDAALAPNSGSLSYAASKGDIVSMTKSLAMTCAPNVPRIAAPRISFVAASTRSLMKPRLHGAPDGPHRHSPPAPWSECSRYSRRHRPNCRAR